MTSFLLPYMIHIDSDCLTNKKHRTTIFPEYHVPILLEGHYLINWQAHTRIIWQEIYYCQHQIKVFFMQILVITNWQMYKVVFYLTSSSQIYMNIEPISRSCITYSTVISLDCARNNIALNYDLTHAPESCFLCENLLQQLHSRLKRDLKSCRPIS